MICPTCHGSGDIGEPKHKEINTVAIKKEMAIRLTKQGFSLRQIQRALGYKSVRSVHLLIHKK
jgi:hypothetical protein